MNFKIVLGNWITLWQCRDSEDIKLIQNFPYKLLRTLEHHGLKLYGPAYMSIFFSINTCPVFNLVGVPQMQRVDCSHSTFYTTSYKGLEHLWVLVSMDTEGQLSYGGVEVICRFLMGLVPSTPGHSRAKCIHLGGLSTLVR